MDCGDKKWELTSTGGHVYDVSGSCVHGYALIMVFAKSGLWLAIRN